MALFGLSFGTKKNSTDQTTDVNKTETQNQTQTGTNLTTGVTDQTTSQQAQSSTTGVQSGKTAGTSQTNSTSAGTTTGTTSTFSDPVLQGIESLVSQMFGSVNASPTISDFNVDEFVSNGMQAADLNIRDRIETDVNKLVNNVGGSAGSNSAVALLANKMKNAGAAESAGIKSQLTAQGEGIARENTLASNEVAATSQGFLGSLLSALKGGVVTQQTQEQQVASQNQQTAGITDSTTSENTASSATSQSQQTQQLLEEINQLINGTATTVGTEHLVGTQKQSGGGFSLGL